MKVWRSGTSECSPASARASSRLGRISIASAATGIENPVSIFQREVARRQQDSQVVEQVGGLLGHTFVRLLARRAGDLFGLLLHLVADQRRVSQQRRRPR